MNSIKSTWTILYQELGWCFCSSEFELTCSCSCVICLICLFCQKEGTFSDLLIETESLWNVVFSGHTTHSQVTDKTFIIISQFVIVLHTILHVNTTTRHATRRLPSSCSTQPTETQRTWSQIKAPEWLNMMWKRCAFQRRSLLDRSFVLSLFIVSNYWRYESDRAVLYWSVISCRSQ